MILAKGQRLLIARTPNREGLVFEVSSADKKYSLVVDLKEEKKILIKKIGFYQVPSLLLTFKTSSDCLLARIHMQTAKIEFFLPDSEPKGCAYESSWSLFGGADVKDEANLMLGSIKYGFKKDRFILDDERVAGFIVRTPQKFGFVPSSKAHLMDRFEFINDSTDFDERLLYVWLCRRIFGERST
jgi:hypothetical protein